MCGGGGFELGTLHPGELLPEAERRWSPLAPRVAQEWAGQLERGQEGGPSASSRLPCRQAWRWRHKAFWAGNRATSTCPGGWGPHSAPGRPLLLPKWAGSTPWSDLGQEGSTGSEALGEEVGGGVSGHQAVVNFLKNTLFGFFLFLEDYMKREPYRKVSQPGPRPGRQQRLPARAGACPPPCLPPGSSPALCLCVQLSVAPAEALLGGGGREAVLDAEDDEGAVAARCSLLQQPARQQRGGLARGRPGLSPPRLAVALRQPAPAGVRAVPQALLGPARGSSRQSHRGPPPPHAGGHTRQDRASPKGGGLAGCGGRWEGRDLGGRESGQPRPGRSASRITPHPSAAFRGTAWPAAPGDLEG